MLRLASARTPGSKRREPSLSAASRSMVPTTRSSDALIGSSTTRIRRVVLGTLAPCGRHRTEFQKLLGYFMNPVPLQFRVSGTDTFGELMLHVQKTISGAISHA